MDIRQQAVKEYLVDGMTIPAAVTKVWSKQVNYQ